MTNHVLLELSHLRIKTLKYAPPALRRARFHDIEALLSSLLPIVLPLRTTSSIAMAGSVQCLTPACMSTHGRARDVLCPTRTGSSRSRLGHTTP